MTPFLAGFADELTKVGAPVNPTAGIETKMDKLLKGGLQRYLGAPEIRHPTFPSMEAVANRPYTDRAPKIDARPPKPPR